MKKSFGLVLILFTSLLYSQNRVITTGVPFLLITSDARSAGMGEQGVATTPDAFSQNWNRFTIKNIFSMSVHTKKQTQNYYS